MKERLVICRPNEEDTGGPARVTRDEVGASSTCRLNRDMIV